MFFKCLDLFMVKYFITRRSFVVECMRDIRELELENQSDFDC